MKALGATAVLISLISGPLLAQAAPSPASQLATIAETEAFDIHSSVVDADFRISVALPAGYHQTDRRYRVLYVLDASWTFGMARDLARLLAPDGSIPPLLVVGVGYPGTTGEALAFRFRDLTPTRNERADRRYTERLAERGLSPAPSGGADNFLRFLTDELIPIVQRRYRADAGHRTLHGHSLSGMFVLHVLFRQPEAFSHYIAAAPSLRWDQGVTFRNEQAYAAHHDSLPAKLYFATGLLDGPNMLTNVGALVDTLTVREYKGFQWEVSFLEGETHNSVIPVVLRDGLRWIFPDSTR